MKRAEVPRHFRNPTAVPPFPLRGCTATSFAVCVQYGRLLSLFGLSCAGQRPQPTAWPIPFQMATKAAVSYRKRFYNDPQRTMSCICRLPYIYI